MSRFVPIIIIIACLVSAGCKKKLLMETIPVYHPGLQWKGRILQDNSGIGYLVGSASSVKIRFHGTECHIWMQNVGPAGENNYISWDLDGIHYKRIPVRFDTLQPFKIPIESGPGPHELELFKETEASCGYIAISKIEVEKIDSIPVSKKKKIEFIGNSITAGMASDPSSIPCDEGATCDHHNVYEAYGPRVARALDMDYMIVAVSGIGAYRNWGTDFPVMSDVYESTFLTGHAEDPKWDFESFIADVVCINLGTNDFSDGDGITPRLPFDSVQFINRYTELIEKVYRHYPRAIFFLLQHPMSGEHNMDLLATCLESVKDKAEKEMKGLKPINIFSFSSFVARGCTGHPGVEDHGNMANELAPVIKNVLAL